MRVPDLSLVVSTLMQTRQTTLPKRLMAPGPNASELVALLGVAASAPDHNQLLPWRFVLVPQDTRILLAEVFARALLERDATAFPDQLDRAREKAFRSPLLMLAYVNGACSNAEVDLHERIVSAGCAVQNMLLMATAMGYGSALTSGKALKTAVLRQLFNLQVNDHALCFISVGTAQSSKVVRARPQIDEYVSHLTQSQGVAHGYTFEPAKPSGTP